MVIERVQQINEISDLVLAGKPSILRFIYKKKSAVEALTQSEYMVYNDTIYYNSQIKLFDRHLLKFLQGYVEIEIVPTNASFPPTPLSINFHQLIWNSVKKLSEYEAEGLFVGQDELLASRDKNKSSLLSLPSHDQSDNIVFYYFYYKPKSIRGFYDEYPFGNQISFYRSLLSLAVAGYLKLGEAFPMYSKGDMLHSIQSATSESKHAEQSDTAKSGKINGLRKILNAIKSQRT
ncbi:hypothetical protein Ctha_0549 [Chloroherpeton thalassium ATCC 35110]|uniref:Uncharacterized protein n=1 Tax=Chloroherpeton thalassium (strain ATCC 35110 / GB-78) TaxID=517418 RepID=B3QV66_CHLT3|nr:hypothetical protein [Chloroherpeton thalassium]ACF13020.1 hypothetical protein Ctha_0549 [Chloroherpeton thalassium ATCC 35110]